MLSWVSVNALDGSILADLPTLRVGGSLNRTIGRYEAQTATLPLDGAPENWRTATRKKSVFLVALSEETESEPRGLPVWGGMVNERKTSHGAGISMSLATPEDYLDDRFVGNESLYTWPQNTIVRYLVEKYIVPDGIPIRVQELPGANPVRGRTYTDADDKTVYATLEELSGIIGGPEWTIGWEWVGEKLGMVLYVGERLGAATPEGLGPAHWFELPGNVQNAELTEGYKRGDGANDVMAVSSGTEDARPQSRRLTAPPDGRPKVEFRWTPSTSITDLNTLEDHAQRALEGLKGGTVALSITGTRDESTAIELGDDIGFNLKSPAWPDGIQGTARAIGIQWTDTTVTPILDVTGIEGIG